MASLDLGVLKISIGVDNKEANKQLGETENQVKKTGSSISAVVKGIGKGVAVAATAIAGATTAVVSGMWNMATDTAEACGTILDASTRMGISAENFQELNYAANMSGVSMSDMETAAKKLAATGSSLTFDQAITQIAGISDESERAAAAQELFGKSAYNLTPLLNEGVEGIAALRNEAREYGLVMSNEAVSSGETFGDSLDRLGVTFDGIKNKIASQLIPSFNLITDGLAGILAGTEGAEEQFSQGMQSFATTLSDLVPTILKLAGDIILSLVNGIVANLPSIITSGVNVVLTLVQALIENLPLILEAGIQCVIAIIEGIAEALPELIPAILEAVMTMVDALIDNLPLILQAGIQLLIGLLQGFIDALPTLIAWIPTIIDNVIDTLITMIPMIIDCGIKLLISLVEALPTIIKAIVAAIPKIINGIVSKLDTLIPLIIQAGIDLFVALIENLPTIIVEIVKAIPQIIEALVEGFGSMLSKMAEIGLNLIKGIWNGIDDAAAWLWDKVSGFCSDLFNNIKNFFGIKSPSTETAWFGEMLVAGLAEGIDDNADAAAKAMKNMGKAVEDAFNPSITAPELDTSAYSLSNGSITQKVKATLELKGGTAASGDVVQNNYFTSREMTSYEQLQQIKRLNKGLLGVNA